MKKGTGEAWNLGALFHPHIPSDLELLIYTLRGEIMKKRETLVSEVVDILWPYVQELVEELLAGRADVEEATAESLAELVCYRVEPAVRRMVETMNEKMRNGEIEGVRATVQRNPEAARKASKYVAKRLKSRVRKLVAEELAKSKNTPPKRPRKP
jgi:hypothetical protein